VAAAAVAVGALVVTSGGADPAEPTAASPSTDATGEPGAHLPEGEVGGLSFSAAEAAGRLEEVTFPAACDLETGRVLLPLSFAPECYADADGTPGHSAPGVTEDAIRVVVYLPRDDDIVMTIAMAAVRSDDTSEQVRATYEALSDMYGSVMQTYGRTVELVFLEGSGSIADDVAARADAVRAMEDLDAFAVWGGPLLSSGWTEEVQARGGICIDCPALEEPGPTVFSVVPSADQTRQVLVEYLTKKLAGRPAVHAGDDAFYDRERVFGYLHLDTGTPAAKAGLDDLRRRLDEADVELAEVVGYALEPARFAEQAATAVARFQAAGVTTVVFSGDPLAPKTITEVATEQGYFPEWVVAGSTLVDTTAFARTFDQQQWRSAFGFSALTARLADGLADPERLHQWWTGGPAPADEMIKVFYPQPTLFFMGLQAAGPDLTAESFRAGLFSLAPQEPARTRQVVTFGDHGLWDELDQNGVDDFVEMWWDPDTSGPDEVGRDGRGMYRYVDGGRRYLPGGWGGDLRVFDPEGAVAVFDELPPDERPAEVPPPAR
jgi:hypothetical protein